jgi:hypothetical protein
MSDEMTARVNAELLGLMRQYAALRRKEAEEDGKVLMLAAQLTETLLWQKHNEAQLSSVAIRTKADALRDTIRKRAEDAYYATGDKAPALGLTVKIFKRCLFDVGTALEWCRKNAPVFIKETLDAKGFERMAMTLDSAPVTVVEEPRAQVATALDMYREEAGA